MAVDIVEVSVSGCNSITVSSAVASCGGGSIDTSNFLTTGNAFDLYYPRTNPSGYSAGVAITSIVSGISVTGFIPLTGLVRLSGAGSVSVLTGLNNLILISGSPSDSTGQFYPYSNPSNFAHSGNVAETGQSLQNQINSINSHTGNFYLSNNEQRMKILLPTGIESTGIIFNSSFSSIPLIFNNLENPSGIIYSFTVSGVGNNGYTGFFSDIIREQNTYLYVLAKII